MRSTLSDVSDVHTVVACSRYVDGIGGVRGQRSLPLVVVRTYAIYGIQRDASTASATDGGDGFIGVNGLYRTEIGLTWSGRVVAVLQVARSIAKQKIDSASTTVPVTC